MKRPESDALSFTEMFDLPVSVDLQTAARALGICRATAYKLIAQGCFPCRVLRVGGRYRVPTTEMMRVLGIDDRPVYTVDLDDSIELSSESLVQ